MTSNKTLLSVNCCQNSTILIARRDSWSAHYNKNEEREIIFYIFEHEETSACSFEQLWKYTKMNEINNNNE